MMIEFTKEELNELIRSMNCVEPSDCNDLYYELFNKLEIIFNDNPYEH